MPYVVSANVSRALLRRLQENISPSFQLLKFKSPTNAYIILWYIPYRTVIPRIETSRKSEWRMEVPDDLKCLTLGRR